MFSQCPPKAWNRSKTAKKPQESRAHYAVVTFESRAAIWHRREALVGASAVERWATNKLSTRSLAGGPCSPGVNRYVRPRFLLQSGWHGIHNQGGTVNFSLLKGGEVMKKIKWSYACALTIVITSSFETCLTAIAASSRFMSITVLEPLNSDGHPYYQLSLSISSTSPISMQRVEDYVTPNGMVVPNEGLSTEA